MHGVSLAEFVDRAEAWCDSIGYDYLRLNPPFKQILPLDTAEKKKVAIMISRTRECMLEKYNEKGSKLKRLTEDIKS